MENKTVQEILLEEGVTQVELDYVFPPDYVPLTVHLEKLSSDERTKRFSETKERLKKLPKAPASDAIKQPSAQQLLEKYTLEQDSMTEIWPGLKAILGFMDQAHAQKAQIERERLNKAISAATEILSFDAKKARQIWLDVIKKNTNLTGILSLINDRAKSGKSETSVDYVSEYDKLRLKELGFTLSKATGQGAMYSISWE